VLPIALSGIAPKGGNHAFEGETFPRSVLGITRSALQSGVGVR
jgi:hypothetical protein